MARTVRKIEVDGKETVYRFSTSRSPEEKDFTLTLLAKHIVTTQAQLDDLKAMETEAQALNT